MKKIEDYYPLVIADLLKYIDEIKQDDSKKEFSLVDIIMEFSDKCDVEVELVGDAIRSDIYFMSFVKSDCTSRNIILSDKTIINEW